MNLILAIAVITFAALVLPGYFDAKFGVAYKARAGESKANMRWNAVRKVQIERRRLGFFLLWAGSCTGFIAEEFLPSIAVWLFCIAGIGFVIILFSQAVLTYEGAKINIAPRSSSQ